MGISRQCEILSPPNGRSSNLTAFFTGHVTACSALAPTIVKIYIIYSGNRPRSCLFNNEISTPFAVGFKYCKHTGLRRRCILVTRSMYIHIYIYLLVRYTPRDRVRDLSGPWMGFVTFFAPRFGRNGIFRAIMSVYDERDRVGKQTGVACDI